MGVIQRLQYITPEWYRFKTVALVAKIIKSKVR
jgi:hypothetical protein